MSSEHHQTVALAFPRNGDLGKRLGAGDKSVLGLLVPDLANGGARGMEWHLPLSKAAAPPSPTGGSLPLSLGALLPLLAGLLVAFSPCAVHMTTYYLPLLGGASRPGTKGKLALVSGLFTLGFAIPYTVAGVVVGYAGQFTKTSPFLGGISQPLTIVAGAIVLYFGLQLIGMFRLPFLLRLNLPTLRPRWSRTGHFASGFLGLNLAVGCLGCVGGSLFAALLLYSGAAGSPLEGGIILFLFALAANVPFFLAALTLGRLQLRNRLPLSVTRFFPLVSGAMLISLGLLILSGTESLVEDTLFQALGIGKQG
ncbi:MAG: sulfite exporter TauE/SafE family protein [Chloroflexi bacterium]|nr:sulfite exporter TauE/SafE family protein [Chloroflexota bacterium]